MVFGAVVTVLAIGTHGQTPGMLLSGVSSTQRRAAFPDIGAARNFRTPGSTLVARGSDDPR